MSDMSERLINPDGDRPDLSWIRPGSYGPDGSPIDWTRPVRATGELRNLPERPRPWHMPISEAISPTMGGYGLGYGLGSAGLAARDRQYGEALGELGLLAAGMIMPGPKGGGGPKAGPRGLAPTHAPVDSLGYYSKALDSAMSLPQARGTPEQMLAQLRAAGIKQAEIEATGLDKLFASKNAPELPASAALRFNGKVYSGRDHSEAITRAWHDAPDGMIPEQGGDLEGYVTNLGKFVTRQQADDMLVAAGLKEPSVMRALGLHSMTLRDLQSSGKWPKDSLITRDEIVKHLTDNRVGVRESEYGLSLGRQALGKEKEALRSELAQISREYAKKVGSFNSPEERADPRVVEIERRFKDLAAREAALPPYRDTKWSDYSLDPSNPTYRETVLHLPEDVRPRLTPVEHPTKPGKWALVDDAGQYKMADSRYHPNTAAWWDTEQFARSAADTDRRHAELTPSMSRNFRSGHFSEPNIIGHMMTSMVKHEGKPVYLIDQIQSDWGQKLRDGGVRDEEKIAELKRRIAEIEGTRQAVPEGVTGAEIRGAISALDFYRTREALREAADNRHAQVPYGATSLGRALEVLEKLPGNFVETVRELNRLDAELRTAEAAAPGHPLVNTTDQWTNTTLKRALRQAADEDAAGVAIPSGRTVLSYNPGDEHGMGVFYDKIVPKNLGNILANLDPAISRQIVEQMETPGKGMAGRGFSYFPLTDEAKAAIRRGLPLFGLGSALAAPTLADMLKER